MAALGTVLLLSAGGCGQPSGPISDAAVLPTSSAVADVAAAQELLSPGSALPLRPEVIALTDRLSIRSARAKDQAEAVQLESLAARLRERIWRFDRRSTDQREALELYGSVVERAAGTAASCAADRRRAELLSQATLRGGTTYQELYLAYRRQAEAARAAAGESQRCVEGLRAALRDVEAFRPSEEGWQELNRRGDAEAARFRALLAGARTTAAASAVSGQSSAPAPGASISTKPQEIVVAPAASMVPDEPADVLRLQRFGWEHAGRVVIELSAPARYQVGMLDPDPAAGRGHRLYLDLFKAKVSKKVQREAESAAVGADCKQQSCLIEGIRLGKRKGSVRVVMDLRAAAFRRIFYLPQPFRIVIDLSTRAPADPEQGPKDRRTVRRVVLDPGHGGWDAGAVGPTGLREKDVVLDIAHRAAPALAGELGIATLLTRDTDRFIPLEERTARANAYHADLFISVHCNATEDGVASGIQIFILDPSREMDALAARVASRENATALSAGVPYDARALDAQVAAVAASLNVGEVTARSRHVSELLRKATLSSLAPRFVARDHGIKTAGFYVLMGAEMPAVLLETAFISNPDDEALLGTADFRQKLADAIVNTVRAYRDGH